MWYTSGIESFISTMETSSLMGMNVARLVADGWKKEMIDKEASGAYQDKLQEAESEGKEKLVKEATEKTEGGNRGPLAQVPMAGKSTGEDL